MAAAHGVSKSWVAKLVGRHKSGGYEAIVAKSKAAKNVANKTPADLEDRIVEWRKTLEEEGFDAGPQTIHYHLTKERADSPSVSTIWRVLTRRGFITPEPHKRPKSSWIRR